MEMKWIKLFEGFEEDGYEKISNEEYRMLKGQIETEVSGNEVPISQKEYNKVKSLFEWKPFKCKLSKDKTIWPQIGGEKTIDEIKIVSHPMNKYVNYSIRIIKVEDEWWLVTYTSESGTKGPKNRWGSSMEDYGYYKCDQLYGLLKFLKDKVK